MAVSLWQSLTFSDVNGLIAKLAHRPATEEDFHSVEAVRANAESEGGYEPFDVALPSLRGGVLRSVLRYEAKLFREMFGIHVVDVHVSIFAALLAVQILRTFEASPKGFSLARELFSSPTDLQRFVVAAALAVFVFLLNILAACFHAQKIEREMLVAYRIQTRLAAYVQRFVFTMSRAAKVKVPSGDITNLAQNDARRIAQFYAHAMVDFPVLFLSVAVIVVLMRVMLGPAAYIGLAIVLLQIPISSAFSWVGGKLHTELMRRSDARVSLVTEWVQASRLVRYFGWGDRFAEDIKGRALSEFRQELKVKSQFAFAFSLSTSWSFLVCLGIFAGFLWTSSDAGAPEIFASIWLASILGHQLNPLPWFVAIYAEARVGARRLETLFASRTQEEEFVPLADVRAAAARTLTAEVKILLSALGTAHPETLRFSYELEGVTVKFDDAPLPLFEDLTLTFPAGGMTAIKGTVGAGKSILLQLLLGDVVPTKGVVWLGIEVTGGAHAGSRMRIPLHTPEALGFVRAFETYVPQEAFVASATVRENVPLRYQTRGETPQATEDAAVVKSLEIASLELDPRTFPDGLGTELGERGVNLSGGQKQRLSLSRSVFAGVNIILLDDPMSAVDKDTERLLVASLFDDAWKGGHRTIIWATHRLDYIDRAVAVVDLDALRAARADKEEKGGGDS